VIVHINEQVLFHIIKIRSNIKHQITSRQSVIRCNLLRGIFSTLLPSSHNTSLLTFLDFFFASATPVRIFWPFHRISISIILCHRKSANWVAHVRQFSLVPLQRALAILEVVLAPYGTSIITALYICVFYQPLAVETSPIAGVNYLP